MKRIALTLWMTLAGALAANPNADLLRAQNAPQIPDFATADESTILAAAAIKSGDDATREALRHAAALRLCDVGTTASLALLREWADTPPQVFRWDDGCRHPILIPSHPFDSTARTAIRRIDDRIAAGEWLERLARGDAGWLATALATQPSAVEELAVSSTATEADDLVVLLAEAPRSPAAARALALTIERRGTLPSADEMAALDPDAAHLLWGRAAPDAPLRALLQRRFPTLRERSLLESESEPDLVTLLAGDGSAGAARAARDTSPDRTAALAAAARQSALARGAIQALLLQGTPASREALRALLAANAIAEPHAAKVRTWLGD